MYETTREAAILTFNTHLNKMRTLRVPDPRPQLDIAVVNDAAQSMIAADIFDEALSMSGRLQSLDSAQREMVRTIHVIY